MPLYESVLNKNLEYQKLVIMIQKKLTFDYTNRLAIIKDMLNILCSDQNTRYCPNMFLIWFKLQFYKDLHLLSCKMKTPLHSSCNTISSADPEKSIKEVTKLSIHSNIYRDPFHSIPILYILVCWALNYMQDK